MHWNWQIITIGLGLHLPGLRGIFSPNLHKSALTCHPVYCVALFIQGVSFAILHKDQLELAAALPLTP